MPLEPANLAATVITRRQTIAALTLGSVALLILGLQPLLLGELVAHHLVSLAGVGLVAMGEIIALGLGVILGNSLLSPARLSGVTMAAGLLLALIDLLSLRLSGDTAFVIVRAVAGLVEGVLVWVTTSVIVRTQAPDRLVAIYLVTQTLAQATIAALLAAVVIPRLGWQGGFVVLAALSAALAALAPALAPGLPRLLPEGSGLPPRSAATVVTFLVILSQMATIGALWAYLDPLGRAAGLSATEVGALISAVLLLQVAGGSAAALVVRRLNARVVLISASLLMGSLAWSLHGPPSPTAFCVLSAAFGFVWMFLMPFQVRLAFEADAAGRVAVLVPALQLLGTALGPLCASMFLVSQDDAHSVPGVCAGFALVALCLLIAGRGYFGTREPIQNQTGEES